MSEDKLRLMFDELMMARELLALSYKAVEAHPDAMVRVRVEPMDPEEEEEEGSDSIDMMSSRKVLSFSTLLSYALETATKQFRDELDKILKPEAQ